MRKFLGILLVLSVLLLGAVPAYADTMIEEVDVSGVTVAAGQAMPTTVTTGEYATVESVSWEKWNFTTNAWEAAGGNFADGNAYRMTAILAPAEGYVFDSACFYSINGEKSRNYAYTNGANTLTVTHDFPLGLTLLREVSLDETPDAKPGDNTVDTLAKLHAADDEPYRITGAKFQVKVGDTVSDFSGTFEESGSYELRVTLAPDPGYWFDSLFDVRSDRTKTSNRNMDQATAWAELRYDFRQPVEEIDISISGAEEGKLASALEITAPDGAPYTFTWEVYDPDNALVTGAFGQDNYHIIVYADLIDKYSFQDNLDVTVNGTAWEDFYYNEQRATIIYWLDMRPFVEKVEVTITGMEPGKQVGDVKVTIPEGAPYEVELIEILDEENDIASGEIGKLGYSVLVRLLCDEKYRFSEEKTVITADGEKPSYCGVSGGEWVLIQQAYFFGETLDRVETGIPKPKAGDPVPAPEWKQHENGKLRYYQIWYKANGDGTVTPTETFEADSTYMVMVALQANAGVRFGKDAVVLAAGKELSIESNTAGQLFGTAYIPVGNAKLVERIDPSAAQPTADKAPGTISGKGKGYEILSGQWKVSDTEDGARKEPGQTFQVGQYVFLELKCKVVEDYIADPTLKVRLNGKDYTPLETVETDEEGNFELVICLGKLKAAQNPNTGDEAPLVLLSVLSIASVLGMGITLKRRRA